ncbi:unnamed protein product, partial [Cuscuta epithymum]
MRGDIMDLKAFAKLQKQLAKESKKKKEEGPSTQKAVDEFFKKPEASNNQEGERPSRIVDAGVVIEGSNAAELKRKNAEKGTKPPEKKKLKGDAGQKAPPVVIIEELSPSKPSGSLPLENFDEGAWPLETVQFPIKKGTAIIHGTLDPREFLRGATPPLDRSTLGRFDDEALEHKALQASVTASVAFGECVRRMEQMRLNKAQNEEALKKMIVTNTEAVRQMAELEETLRRTKEGVEQRLKDAEAKGKAAAERAAAEEAREAVAKAEADKQEAIAQAKKDVIATFTSEGWKSEEHGSWLASVVEASADEWVKGPGAMWLALKGKSFYDGGQYFTQAMIYRRLARHFGVDPKDFDPAPYGLPPLQP